MMRFFIYCCSTLLLLNGCTLLSSDPDLRACGFSESCYYDKERERIIKLSPEEREKEKELCTAHAEHMMSLAANGEKECEPAFWTCKPTKKYWERTKRGCVYKYSETYLSKLNDEKK